MSKKEDFDNAMALLHAVREALKNGIEHFDKNGNILKTDKEIITALVRDGHIGLKTPSEKDDSALVMFGPSDYTLRRK